MEAVQEARDASRPPLVQVLFVVQNTPLPDVVMTNLRIDLVDRDAQSAKFDLSLSIDENHDGDHLDGTWEYNTDLFDTSTIECLQNRFIHLLGLLLAQPEQRLSNLL